MNSINNVYVTTDFRPALLAAKNNMLAVLGAQIAAICGYNGIPVVPAANFFGTVDLGTWMASQGLDTYQRQTVWSSYNMITKVNSLTTFVALDNGNKPQVSYDTWLFVSGLANTPMPSTSDLLQLQKIL